MAGTIITGKNGKVVWNAEDGVSDVDVQFIHQWTLDYIADVADITVMGATSRTYLGGYKEWSAIVEVDTPNSAPDVPLITGEGGIGGTTQGIGANWDDDAQTQKIFLELWIGASASDGIIYGPAISTQISYVTDMNEIIKITYSFQGNGLIGYGITEPNDFDEAGGLTFPV